LIHPKLQDGGKYRIRSKIVDIVDKGKTKGTFVTNRVTGYLVAADGSESAAYYIDRTAFLRTLGGHGFKGTGKNPPILPPPKRSPDRIIEAYTFKNQAMLYRINSDSNPLHVDPKVAALVNYKVPIIHGNILLS